HLLLSSSTPSPHPQTYTLPLHDALPISNCKLLSRREGLKYLHPGEVVFAVVAEASTHEPHRLIAASIGVAIPTDRNTYGYLSERSEEHTSELQSLRHLVCRLLLEKKKKQ